MKPYFLPEPRAAVRPKSCTTPEQMVELLGGGAG